MLIQNMSVQEVSRKIPNTGLPIGKIKESDIKFFKEDGTNNAYINYNGQIFRVRVEMIVINDDGKILAEKLDKPNIIGLEYKLPGGSVEPYKTFIEQAIAEVHEEARVTVDNVVFSGIYHIAYINKDGLSDKQKEKLAKHKVQWDGMLSFIYTGHYTGKYTGKVAKEDYDDFFKKANWYNVKDINLCDEHHRALTNA